MSIRVFFRAAATTMAVNSTKHNQNNVVYLKTNIKTLVIFFDFIARTYLPHSGPVSATELSYSFSLLFGSRWLPALVPCMCQRGKH